MHFESYGTAIDKEFQTMLYAILEIYLQMFFISGPVNNFYFADGAGAGYTLSFLFRRY